MRLQSVLFVCLLTCLGCARNADDNKSAQKATIHCAPYPEPASESGYKSKAITYLDGVAFQKGEAIYIDPHKLSYPSMYLMVDRSVAGKGDVLSDSILTFTDANVLHVSDSISATPYVEMMETEKRYCYKIENDKLWLKDLSSNWEPVTIKYLGKFRGVVAEDREDHPCMLLDIRTKWFGNIYQVMCEDDE